MAKDQKNEKDRFKKLKQIFFNSIGANNKLTNIQFRLLVEQLADYYYIGDRNDEFFYCLPLNSINLTFPYLNDLEKIITEYLIMNKLFSKFTYLNASTNGDDKPRFCPESKQVSVEPRNTPILWSSNANAGLVNERQIRTGRDHIITASKTFTAYFRDMVPKLFNNKIVADGLIKLSEDIFNLTILNDIYGAQYQVFEFKVIHTSCLKNKMYSNIIHFDNLGPMKTIYKYLQKRIDQSIENYSCEFLRAVDFNDFVYPLTYNDGLRCLIPKFQHNVEALKVYFNPIDLTYPAKQHILNKKDALIFKEKPIHSYNTSLATLIILINSVCVFPVDDDELNIHSISSYETIKRYKYFIKYLNNDDLLTYCGLYIDCYLSLKNKHIIYCGKQRMTDSAVNVICDYQADYTEYPEGLVVSFPISDKQFDIINNRYEQLKAKNYECRQKRTNHQEYGKTLKELIKIVQSKITLDETKDIFTNKLLNHLKFELLQCKIDISVLSQQIVDLDCKLQDFMETNIPFIHKQKLLIYDAHENENFLKGQLFTNQSLIKLAKSFITSVRIKIDYWNNTETLYQQNLETLTFQNPNLVPWLDLNNGKITFPNNLKISINSDLFAFINIEKKKHSFIDPEKLKFQLLRNKIRPLIETNKGPFNELIKLEDFPLESLLIINHYLKQIYFIHIINDLLFNIKRVKKYLLNVYKNYEIIVFDMNFEQNLRLLQGIYNYNDWRVFIELIPIEYIVEIDQNIRLKYNDNLNYDNSNSEELINNSNNNKIKLSGSKRSFNVMQSDSNTDANSENKNKIIYSDLNLESNLKKPKTD